MCRIMGEAGGKHVISAMQGDGIITHIQYIKMCTKKSLPRIMGLVIGGTKYCFVKITLLFTKYNVMTLFIMTFLLVRSIISN